MQIDANAHPNVETLVFSDPQKPFLFYSTDGFRLRMYNETPYDASHVYELAPRTFFVSSSLFSKPRFRICPAVGAFSRPWLISAFL